MYKMEEIVFALLEILAEGLFELFGEAIVALAVHGARALGLSPRALNRALSTCIYVGIGVIAGWISFLALPHPLVRPSARFHGISLLISPLLAASGMSLVGSALRRKRRRTTQIETFGYAFAFAFAMALVRFIFVK